MKIELRIADSDLGTVTNVVFKPTKQFKMRLFPLPPDEWVGEQKCSNCSGKPDFLQEDMRPICKKCIALLMVGLNRKESKEETSIPMTWEVVCHARFEWSLDGEKWYSIFGKNIKVDRQEIFLKELKKSIIEKHPMSVEVDYAKETKTMTVTL
jgi:hypothetical protein